MADARLTAAESLLARAREEGRARLRVYIGAAPGVGKSYKMLEDAHELRRQGLDVVVGFIEPHGRADTLARIGDLEQVPLREIAYRGVTLKEMDVEAVKARRPQVVVVDELAHTNAPGSPHQKRYEDVLDLLDAGLNVITAVNIQHIESLNDAIAATTGVRVRETVPDWVLKRADEVVNVDVSVETLRTRLRQGKIYDAAKIEQALANFFRKGNLTALRELALRQLASDQAGKAQAYREREGLERPVIP
jgi:two-component system sensor histidine kinase KdpD